MNIVICYKIVLEEQDFVVSADRSISFAKAEWKIGQYDLNAVEAGVQLAEAGGRAVVLSVGGPELENSKLKKSILSRGPEKLGLVMDPAFKDMDAHRTAQTLAEAIRAWQPDFHLVLCGEGSADQYGQQVGLQLGELLGCPAFNAVSSIKEENGRLIITRGLEDEVEVLSLSIPAVLSVTTDINVPRIPGMSAILAAGKKTVEQIAITPEGRAAINVESTMAPKPTPRRCLIVEGDTREKVAELIDNMRKELGR